MRACVAAARTGVMAEFVEAMMSAVWEEGLDMGDVHAVRTRLDAAGLDGASLLALADDPDVKAELVAHTESAVARGAFGIPTFFVREEMFFGKERLAQVAAALAC
jgi:2-hydroxychromene-2-carboxylate isomerase